MSLSSEEEVIVVEAEATEVIMEVGVEVIMTTEYTIQVDQLQVQHLVQLVGLVVRRVT